MSSPFKRVIIAATASLACGGIGVAFAHHSVPEYFDVSRTVTMQGTIKTFKFENPHSIMELVVKGPDGQPQEWKAEASLAAWLIRNGWSPAMFKPGTAITISGNPARDKGVRMVRLFTVKLSNGKTLNANNGLPTTYAKQ